MHLGVISFCDRVAHNIKSDDIKKQILEDLENKYNIKIIQKHFFKLTNESVNHITATPHVITIRTNGNPYYMYLTKYNNKEIIYFIDKKIHPTYQLPRIIVNKSKFDENLFDGTLLDGEMVNNNDNKWTFLICDMISYKGEYLIKFNLPDRINLIYNMLENEYEEDIPMNMCDYKVKPYFNLCNDTINNITNINFPFTIRGIYFWAYNLKYKPKLFNLDDNLIQKVNIKTKENIEFIEKNNNIKIKSLIKTDNPDIYKIIEDNSYACIQDIKTSHFIRNEFKNTLINESIKFKCIFNNKFNKWTPIEKY
jgi:hypothetical protein